MNRRAAIRMSEAEVAAFLEEERTLTLATIGRDGRPHLMPLWYVPDGEELTGWTYGASQKVRNLERDSRCTVQVEAGTEYGELRGVMLEADCVLHRDEERVWQVGAALARRYGGTEDLTPEAEAALRRQAAKRVALELRPTRTVSWDHRKLPGPY